MSLQLYKSLDPETYLELASKLSTESDEAARRTAADRAYYAAFLVCRDTLARKDYLTPYYNSGDHKYVGDTLKRNEVLGSFGNEEQRLRRARNLVTYDTGDITKTQQNACGLDWMLRTAKNIIDRVKALPPKPRIP